MRFLQIDNGIVTGALDAPQAPTVLPAGRSFVPAPPDATSTSHLLMAVSVDEGGVPTFSETAASTRLKSPPRSNKISKVQFLGLLTPTEFAAWKGSSDPTLVYGLAVFEADTTVDLDNPLIGQVIGQAAALNLITPQRGQQIQAALAALVTP